MSFMDTLRLRARMVRGWRRWAQRIASAVERVLPGAEVYVFGSAVEGGLTGGSDIDLLVIAENLPDKALERASIKVRIEDEARLPAYHPFEIHLATPEEAEQYLRRANGKVERLHRGQGTSRGSNTG